jgi:uncharacterized protein YceH (UPF0502 family)
MVVQLPRQVGQSAVRFAHLLGGPVSSTASAVPAAAVSPAARPSAVVHAASSSDLAAKVQALEEQVAALKTELSELREKLRSAGI